MMYALETNNLRKSFNGTRAVDGLELKVPEGSIYGFLGPNGAGKTTTIKMLTGLSVPSEGEIKIFGKTVEFGSLKNRRDIGYLPDVPGFYDWMTPVEFLSFAGELFAIERKVLRERMDYLLDLVGLNGVKKKIGGFSRGMKQRLGIAQALINEPQIVFFDEPTSALDPVGRKEVMDIIARLSGKVTVFFSTHILSDVERVCDRVVILNKGRMVLEDSISNLRLLSSSREIAMEIGESGDKQDFINDLTEREWVEEIPQTQGRSLKISVNDMAKAQCEIPEVLYKKGIGLRKFIVQEPTLEDIFIKAVNE